MPIVIPDDLVERYEESQKNKECSGNHNNHGLAMYKKIIMGLIFLIIACVCANNFIEAMMSNDASFRALFWFGALALMSLYESIYCFATRSNPKFF